ncbi:uncharacterized protein HMPREF1120_04691 [Exophiala dermatitidis NIH/UT8656]|uniref:Uncharacterized protein n=1 Tax=Exophiala dermatitidis (strain ATCC 34100 / CBS 525.76 / NIH/UT8656) TaxID=858893 RepID=H6BXZ3_EXODN|nr:uncharacterized protein HMPREF1120_04691 [Exophiala dermatitidis NIH/UT8656]EHY56615.1 hypothetical protein HMPREF1120_04691 [Exophiala dermatitidis NIH/UT8656]
MGLATRYLAHLPTEQTRTEVYKYWRLQSQCPLRLPRQQPQLRPCPPPRLSTTSCRCVSRATVGPTTVTARPAILPLTTPNVSFETDLDSGMMLCQHAAIKSTIKAVARFRLGSEPTFKELMARFEVGGITTRQY